MLKCYISMLKLLNKNLNLPIIFFAFNLAMAFPFLRNVLTDYERMLNEAAFNLKTSMQE
jgi:hypothetical protein